MSTSSHTTKSCNVAIRRDLLAIHKEHNGGSLSTFINILIAQHYDASTKAQKEQQDDK